MTFAGNTKLVYLKPVVSNELVQGILCVGDYYRFLASNLSHSVFSLRTNDDVEPIIEFWKNYSEDESETRAILCNRIAQITLSDDLAASYLGSLDQHVLSACLTQAVVSLSHHP